MRIRTRSPGVRHEANAGFNLVDRRVRHLDACTVPRGRHPSRCRRRRARRGALSAEINAFLDRDDWTLSSALEFGLSDAVGLEIQAEFMTGPSRATETTSQPS